MKKRILYTLYFLSLISVFSCKSDGMLLRDNREKNFPLLAKVFNGNNRACAGVLIELSNDQGPVLSGRSDITGKVIFPRVPFGSYRVRMSLSGSETVEFPFDFARADQALYGRIYSFEQLLELADQSLMDGEWDQTAGYLERAESLDMDPQKVLWYKAILSWKQSDTEKALSFLERILEYPDPPAETHLFLADIYQYDLKKNEQALEQLQLYKNRREINGEMESRIGSLEESIMTQSEENYNEEN